MADAVRVRINAAVDCWSLPPLDPENDVELSDPRPADAPCKGTTASAGIGFCCPADGGTGFANGLLSKIELMLCSIPNKKSPPPNLKMRVIPEQKINVSS